MRRDDHGEPRQIPLDDVLAALRGGREAHAAEARVAAGVHEHEHDENRGQEHLNDWQDDVEHGLRIASLR